MINYVYGEQLYQEFVSFRDLFLKKAVARAQHVDAASDGRPVRPVVVLPFKETDSIQAEIDKWTLMARELEQYPDLNIPKTILYPVPNILRGVRKVTTYQTEAVNSVNMTAGHIIHLIDKDIRIQKSAGINEHQKLADTDRLVRLMKVTDRPCRIRTVYLLSRQRHAKPQTSRQLSCIGTAAHRVCRIIIARIFMVAVCQTLHHRIISRAVHGSRILPDTQPQTVTAGRLPHFFQSLRTVGAGAPAV